VTLWGVFATGLLAGGASCAAVQGGLLAGLIARRKGVPQSRARSRRRGKAGAKVASVPAFSGTEDLVPVGGFLTGKLISHTLLGALLGLVGERVQVSFRAQAMMLVLAGGVMVLMALDLLGVRAARRLIPSPPASWTALVRRGAKSSTALAPAALGFLTILIPCGVTLSMELLAIASGSPITGALIMGIFVLGTSPLFAILGYAFGRVRSLLGGNVGKVAAVAVVAVGLVTINSGLVLAGSPLALNRVSGAAGQAEEPPETIQFQDDVAGPPAVSDASSGVQTLVVDVENRGYSPSRVKAKAGLPTKLVLRTDGTVGCTRAFVIPDRNIQRVLPASGTTELGLGTLRAGKLEFTCSMGMYWGEIDVS
jgi:sulfite exporter TauE/SafE